MYLLECYGCAVLFPARIASYISIRFYIGVMKVFELTRHRLGYFRTHDCLGGGGWIRPPAISRTNSRIEPREEAFESSLQDLPKAYLRF